MKVILGGGLVALLAKDILGSDWTILPIGRSRFYSFNPPLADNFVVRDDDISRYMDKWTVMPIMHRYSYSFGGEITFSTQIALRPYLEKLYGNNMPPQAFAYWKDRIDFVGYGDCMYMYQTLHDQFKNEIFNNDDKYGRPTKIEDHIIFTDKTQIEYDQIISTVPLYALLEWLGVNWIELPSIDQFYYHVRTDCLDFEGATVMMVADPEIEFHRAYQVNKLNYVIQSSDQIKQPGNYFMQFMKRFELIAETSIERALCCGPIPNINEIDNADIYCIGSSAVWDDCLDIGSCIKRLIKFGESNG